MGANTGPVPSFFWKTSFCGMISRCLSFFALNCLLLQRTLPQTNRYNTEQKVSFSILCLQALVVTWQADMFLDEGTASQCINLCEAQ